jgi:hypothetical protein
MNGQDLLSVGKFSIDFFFGWEIMALILQAIAVVSCLETEWPVLIVVPSSLRLQWAAVSFTFPLYHSPWVFKCLCFAEV